MKIFGGEISVQAWFRMSFCLCFTGNNILGVVHYGIRIEPEQRYGVLLSLFESTTVRLVYLLWVILQVLVYFTSLFIGTSTYDRERWSESKWDKSHFDSLFFLIFYFHVTPTVLRTYIIASILPAKGLLAVFYFVKYVSQSNPIKCFHI